ncbi:MAG: hypothetical protein R3F02_13855 [Thiolinea sp.]
MRLLKKSLLIIWPGLLILSLAGCDQPPPPPQADIRITDRPIATVYKIRTGSATETVSCYRITNNSMTEMTSLQSEQLVNIVAIEEGLLKFDNQLWLHIYPRLTHRPSCYVNVDNLIPYG